MVFIDDDLDKTVNGLIVEPLLEVVHFRVVPVEGLFGSLEFDHLADHLIQHLSNALRRGRRGLTLLAGMHVQCAQKSLKHIGSTNLYIQLLKALHLQVGD